MNIEAYNTETLRKIVRQLESENRALKEKLREANIPFLEESPFEETITDNEQYDLDQGARIQHPDVITYGMMKAFFVMFWSRSDVFARRSGKGGYYPQCNNSFKKEICPRRRGEKMNCEDCPHQEWTKLAMWRIKAHLMGQKEDGSDVLGFYPLMPDGTCRYLVFDFDNHEKGAAESDYANKDEEWHNEVDALREMCERNGIKPLVERSRSGRGAHVWIFFETAIPAATARNFGFLLLDKGAESINMKTFHYYDRMYPSQDVASKLGNLIALPLQGRALRNGNSAFVDKNWNAYPNQWDILLNGTKKLTLEEVEYFIAKWKQELADARGMLPDSAANRQKPWRQTCKFQKEDVTGKLHMVLSDGVYIDTLNLTPRLQNAIRRLAAFDNPAFYKKKRLGYSNYYEFTAIYLGKDVDGSSSDIRQNKVERLILIAQTIQERGVKVTVITTDPEDEKFGSADVYYQLIQMMEQAGIRVVKKSDVAEQFAVIDDRLVWHGGMHLLGKEDAWDNLIRIQDVDVAAELLVKVLGEGEET